METEEMESGVVPILNVSGVDVEWSALSETPEMKKLQRELSRWADMGRQSGRPGRPGSLFDRQIFTPPDNVFEEMRAARRAASTDDIVSGVAELTEAFAFQGLKWESEVADDADIFNQIAADLNLDVVLRRMWREEFETSQCYIAMVWDYRDYTVRGRNPVTRTKTTDPMTGKVTFDSPLDESGRRKKGVKRKRTVRVWVPTQVRVLDSAKIVPIGFSPLGSERLAWQATEWEINQFQAVLDGTKVDPMLSTFYLGRYTPDPEEQVHLNTLGVVTDHLIELNPKYVQRHTVTKPDYARFAEVRLKSCFQLLDMKRQLLASDRAALVGAANYIILVRKGSKEEPAKQEELMNLRENYSVLARLPVIISDHRLEIEIIAPKIDLTLQQEKYDVLDTRLMARLLGTLSLGARGQRNETNITISHAVARGMENRRHMIKRFIEFNIARAITSDPRNEGQFEAEPNLVFTPRNISLGFDAALTQLIANLRTSRDMSRETILEFVGLDQATEAQRMEIEEEMFDDIFKTRQPFDSPLNNPGNPDSPLNGQNKSAGSPQADGAKGGRPAGGGKPSANPSKPKPKSPAGNTSTAKG